MVFRSQTGLELVEMPITNIISAMLSYLVNWGKNCWGKKHAFRRKRYILNYLSFLLLLCILATCKVLLEQIATCEGVHWSWFYIAPAREHQPTDTITRHITLRLCKPILMIMLSYRCRLSGSVVTSISSINRRIDSARVSTHEVPLGKPANERKQHA